MTPSKPHKSVAASPKLSASIILLHGQVHPLSAHLISSSALAAAEEEMNVSSQAAGGEKKNSHVFRSDLLVHLFFCVHFLSFVRFGFGACTTRFCDELADGSGVERTRAMIHRILQCQGRGPGSFSIPTWWRFCLSPINQAAVPAELCKRKKKAFEANKEEKDIFRMYWRPDLSRWWLW